MHAPSSFGHKVTDRHRERLAIVCVRQSTARQGARPSESTPQQYGRVERAADLGWPRAQVLIIDDDLGLLGRPRPTAGPASSGCSARWRWIGSG